MNIYDELHERALELVKKWNKFDFENLEYWENNSKWASFMRASESSESDSLCLVYNIFEARKLHYDFDTDCGGIIARARFSGKKGSFEPSSEVGYGPGCICFWRSS